MKWPGPYKEIIQRLVRSSLPFWIFLLVAGTWIGARYDRYIALGADGTLFSDDADQYYSYLPSVFIHKDLNMRSSTRYWAVELPNGNRIQKFTCGVAIMEAPFFLAGHLIAKAGGYAADGYSAPYNWSIYIGVILYVFAGLYFLYRSLRFYFSEWISTLTIAFIFMATNLFFYTVAASTMSHAFLFFLDSVFIFNTLKWLKEGRLRNMIFLALAGSMAILIRPTEFVIFLIPLLMPAGEGFSLREKFRFLSGKKFHLLAALLVFLLVITPQLIYWKIQTGKFIHYSYGEEHFFFSDPKMWKMIFGYRNGMIPYSPVQLLSLLGFVPLFIFHRRIFWSFFIFSLVNIYLLSCWWDYGFGGSFGNRALVQSYSSLAFPMAALIAWIYALFSKKFLQIIPVALSIAGLWFFIHLNLLMHRQFLVNTIHWCGMTKEAYWWVFNRENISREDFIYSQRFIRVPDFGKMIKGERDQ